MESFCFVHPQREKDSESEGGAFSDAYLSTQPAKRRRLAADSKPAPGSTVRDLVGESLREALSGSSAASPAAAAEAAAREVGAAAEEEVRERVRRRLAGDRDFSADR